MSQISYIAGIRFSAITTRQIVASIAARSLPKDFSELLCLVKLLQGYAEYKEGAAGERAGKGTRM